MRKYFKITFILFLIILIVSVLLNKSFSRTIEPLKFDNDVKPNVKLEDNLEIKVNVEKELFPVVAKFFTVMDENCTYGLVKWTIKNKNNEPITLTLTTKIQDWTPSIIKTIKLNPNEIKEFLQTPFSIQLLTNQTIIPATVLLNIKLNDKTIFEETRSLNIRAYDDMVWSLYKLYDTESLIAAWVTPKDDMVEKILSLAKERRFFDRTLNGYQSNDVIGQVRAIFNAVREYGVSYVSSTVSFGKVGLAQRVRLPKESISQKSANCIDGAVLFASLFENIGLEPLIVLIPGHAFVGVRTSPNSREILFIETTMVGRSITESIKSLERTFDAAVREGNAKYNFAVQTNPNSVRIIDIKAARNMGIYPLE